jgi:CBS-domain-containing membrane protein
VESTLGIRGLARVMLDGHIHRVGVVDGHNRLVGIISSTDVLAAVAYADRGP